MSYKSDKSSRISIGNEGIKDTDYSVIICFKIIPKTPRDDVAFTDIEITEKQLEDLILTAQTALNQLRNPVKQTKLCPNCGSRLPDPSLPNADPLDKHIVAQHLMGNACYVQAALDDAERLGICEGNEDQFLDQFLYERGE